MESMDEGFVGRMEASVSRGNIWMCQVAARVADVKDLQRIANDQAADSTLVDRAKQLLTRIQNHMNAASMLHIGDHVSLIHEYNDVPKNTTGVITLINGDDVIVTVDGSKKQIPVKKLVLEVHIVTIPEKHHSFERKGRT